MTFQDIEPPRLGRQAALDITSAYFGVTGNLTPLASERDQIFKLTTSGKAHFVLRISSPDEAPAVLEFQNEALLKIAADYPALPVPRLRASVNSRLVERLQQRDGRSYGVRLFSFLPGEALDGRPLSPALYCNIGSTLATLDRALKGLRRPPVNEKFLWNMHQVANLYPLVGHIEEAENRRLVEAVFERLHASAFATLAELRSQVIHNDCNA
jgi:Ser/Thr protein kinase RdoA (MazF antagonist)